MSNEFLDSLFGDEEGFVYSPVKENGWKQHFFEWPKESPKLEEHINNFHTRDVYVSPVLFSQKKITPESFKGTYHLWTEFDGSLPKDAIQPSMRVQSSAEGREHWYWRMDSFLTDKATVEDLTKRICFNYGADPSAWDYQQVLRPPNTWNHKRNRPVTLVDKNDKIYALKDFLLIPIPPVGMHVAIKLQDLPPKEVILAKYKWGYDALDLLFKDVPQGSRSHALVRLAFECIEAGCSNEEAFVLLEDRDTAWGKFVGRDDRNRRLEDCISHARRQKAVTSEIIQSSPEIYRFHDFMRTRIQMKWVVKDLLPVAGSMVIVGKPGIGKSTFSLRLGMSIALGKPKFLHWDIVNRPKVLFISLEMQHGELKSFFSDMNISEDEQQQLQEWFHIWPIGHAYPFDTHDQQLELLKHIDTHKIELIIIDSLGLSIYGNLTDDSAIKRLNSFLNEDVRKERKCGYIFIHHGRKQGIEEGKKTIDLDDLFGSIYIAANAQTVMLLHQKTSSARMLVKFLKIRLAENSKEFEMERTSDRGFKLLDSNKDNSTTDIKAPPDKATNAPIFGKLSDI